MILGGGGASGLGFLFGSNVLLFCYSSHIVIFFFFFQKIKGEGWRREGGGKGEWEGRKEELFVGVVCGG